MKDNLKEIILMGLGAISLTDEKAKDLKNELLKKGETIYQEGAIKNEELKRDIKEKLKGNSHFTKEELFNVINSLSDEEKDEVIKLLQTKNCENNSTKD